MVGEEPSRHPFLAPRDVKSYHGRIKQQTFVDIKDDDLVK